MLIRPRLGTISICFRKGLAEWAKTLPKKIQTRVFFSDLSRPTPKQSTARRGHMSELTPEPTSRLRRRSFFENIENDGTSASTVTVSESDLTTAASTGGALSDSESCDTGTALLKPVKVGTKHFSSSTDDHTPVIQRSQLWACAQVALKWVQVIGQYVVAGAQVVGTAWASRFPAAASKVDAWRHKALWCFVYTPRSWIKRWRGEELAGPVKYWVYPTQYLTYASVSLFLLEVLIYCYFYTVPLEVRVH